jgi:hypothetical protein
MKNLFLTEIAKDYNAEIESVEFRKLPIKYSGLVYYSESRGGFIICIEKEKMRCMKHLIYILFHEIAHVQFRHIDVLKSNNEVDESAIEKEADHWAFKELGIIDSENRPAADDILCYECLKSILPLCKKQNMFVQE